MASTFAELETRKVSLLKEMENPDLSTEDLERISDEAEKVATEIRDHNTRADQAAQARKALESAVPAQRAGRNPEGTSRDLPPVRGDEIKTLGQRLVDSDELSNFKRSSYHGNMSVDAPELSIRALIAGSAGGIGTVLQQPALVPGFVQQFYDRRLRVADLVDKGRTTNNSVIYIRDDTPAGAGAYAAEVAEGNAKPEAAFTFTRQTAPVATIANWVPITRQVADDNAELESYVEGRLMFGLEYRLDSQILNGDGTGSNLTGILNSFGLQTYSAPTAEQALISIRKGITKAMNREYMPDAVVVHPADWEKIELARTTGSGEFMLTPNAANMVADRIWGLPVAITTACPQGTAVVGAFRMGATLWDRMQAQILMSDSHADYFVKNTIALLAELRAALTVWRGAAFVSVSFGATGN